MIRLLLYALVRPFVGWAALLLALVLADAAVRSFAGQVLLPALDSVLPRAATAALALLLLCAATFLGLCWLVLNRRWTQGPGPRNGGPQGERHGGSRGGEA